MFLAFVLYLGWDGGSLGRWLGDVARWLVGILAFALPLLLGFLAYLLVVKEERRPRRGMTWGVVFIVAGLRARGGRRRVRHLQWGAPRRAVPRRST